MPPDAADRSIRQALRAAAIAGVLGGTPSVTQAALTRGPTAAGAYLVTTTRAAGTVLPPGRPGLVRGALAHATISATVATLLARTLPRHHEATWGAAYGLAIGVVNLRVIAPRWFPDVAALPLRWQLADHAAFGAVVGAMLRQAGESASSAPNARSSAVALPSANSLVFAAMK